MLSIDSDLLKKRIINEYPMINMQDAEGIALKMIKDSNEKLEENVCQWLRKEPLSDGWIREYCINAIMSIR